MDQMTKVMEEMKENMRRTNPIEDLVHRTDSPFTASVNGHPLPSKFKLPSLDSYDGTRDPFNHIATFKTTMHLQGVPDEIMCRAFPTTLKGPVRVWFGKISPGSVGSFEELSKLFVNNFIGGQRHKRSSSSLLTIETKACGHSSLASTEKPLVWTRWMTSFYWRPFTTGLILIYLSTSCMRRSLKPWPS